MSDGRHGPAVDHVFAPVNRGCPVRAEERTSSATSSGRGRACRLEFLLNLAHPGIEWVGTRTGDIQAMAVLCWRLLTHEATGQTESRPGSQRAFVIVEQKMVIGLRISILV